MFSNNVSSLLINCNDLHEDFLKCAIYYAGLGLNVWYISPQPFDHLPNDIKPPNKETLKLITFLYLKDKKDLLSHLNSIHNWRRCPELLILNRLDYYGDVGSNLAFLSASILDAMVVCSRKSTSHKSFLIVGIECPSYEPSPYLSLYFNNISSYLNKTDSVLKDIISYFDVS